MVSGNNPVTLTPIQVAAARVLPRGRRTLSESVFGAWESKRVMAEQDDDKVVPLSARGAWTRKGDDRPRPMPSTADLARALDSVDHTLSEVLVLLYQVVHTNQVLFDLLRRDGVVNAAPRTAPGVPAAPRGTSDL